MQGAQGGGLFLSEFLWLCALARARRERYFRVKTGNQGRTDKDVCRYSVSSVFFAPPTPLTRAPEPQVYARVARRASCRNTAPLAILGAR